MDFSSRRSRPELIKGLLNLKGPTDGLELRKRLVYELEVYQAELEFQNRQLRESQQLLEASNQRYADLYDFAPVAYVTIDLQCNIAEANLTGANLLNEVRSKLIGKRFTSFMDVQDRPSFEHYISRSSDQSLEKKIDVTLSVRNRTPVVVELISTAAFDVHGKAIGFRVALTDISSRKAAEEALKLSVRMREGFLAIVSHDLRNPLNVIVMGVECIDQCRCSGS